MNVKSNIKPIMEAGKPGLEWATHIVKSMTGCTRRWRPSVFRDRDKRQGKVCKS